MPVGRRRTKHKNLPPRLHLKRGRYYYGRNQEFLADNLADALPLWAEREAAKVGRRPRTFKELAEQYQIHVIPHKSARTQRDNLRELAQLLAVFAVAPLEKIEPAHIRGYLDNRMAMPRKGRKPAPPKLAKTRANREIALFSDIWNWGREAGMMKLPNPRGGVTLHKEVGRDRYVTDEELSAVWLCACEPLRDALDLHYLTGQRPADVLRMSLRDLRDGCLWVRQGKTKKPLRVVQEGPLAAVLERISARTYPQAKVTSMALVRDENGQPLTYDALFNRFEKARAAVGIHFQLRDLRAKTATDLDDLALAQGLLGHTTRAMTERYVKTRIGEKVRPILRTGREIADKK